MAKEEKGTQSYMQEKRLGVGKNVKTDEQK